MPGVNPLVPLEDGSVIIQFQENPLLQTRADVYVLGKNGNLHLNVYVKGNLGISLLYLCIREMACLTKLDFRYFFHQDERQKKRKTDALARKKSPVFYIRYHR